MPNARSATKMIAADALARYICERRFERVIGDRTGFVSIVASIAAYNHLMALQSLPLARRRGCAAVARTTGRPSACFGADLADGAACSHRGLHCGPACAAQPIMRRRKRRVAQQPPLRGPEREFLPSFLTDRADEAEGTAWRAQSGARRSGFAAHGPWRGASTAFQAEIQS